jgi:catechol 2,3-dioxygenase-like lactoylglutathione lyase family enzyme
MTDSPRLGGIACVTVRTPDLAAAEEAYGAHLGYRAISKAPITTAQAGIWGLPGLSGARSLLMAPPVGDDCVFRFIEAPAEPGYRAFTRHGWNAAELIVARVDPLAERLANSPFEIVAPPMDLSFCSDIRAMQIRGPGGEILYLTEFKKPVPGLDAPPARCEVDRVFIVIVGGSSLDDMQSFYAERFAVPRAPAMESRVQTMALEFGLPRDHRFRLAALPLRERCYIEADEMPSGAEASDQGGLAPGISMVSFLGDLPGPATAGLPAYAPYGPGRRAACIQGAAGEMLEIISD